ncbi:MAG: glycosyl transferase family 39 [Stenomitos rutilans HA7619-LM2]|jgi:uncharacterized membrane protein|nr:glycosyl transferase family 39 [Stenomitos rutilans HA7619-LM2]
MKAVFDQNRPLSPTWLRLLVIHFLVMGIVFHFVNLNHKVYAPSEVETSLRAAGYTQQAVAQAIFQNQVIPAKDLLRFQQPKPDSTLVDTVRSLALETPQHPPLYFLLDRLWVQTLGRPIQALFGSPLTAPRLLPAWLSLLALPLMAALAWELFASSAIALLATTFLALSPFEILFAQTACPLTLLTLAVIASHYLLLRATRLSDVPKIRSRDVLKRPPFAWQHWGLYTLVVTLGLYTHPLFVLILIGHTLWIMQSAIASKSRISLHQRLNGFWLSLLVAGLLFMPWLLVWLTHVQHSFTTSQWHPSSSSLGHVATLWLLSVTTVFLDVDSGFGQPWLWVIRLCLAALIVWAFYALYQRVDRAWLFVLTSTIMPFLVLVLSDLVLNSQQSTVNPAFALCYPGVQLAIASFLATRLTPKPHYLSARPRRSINPSRFILRFTSYTWTFASRMAWRIVLLALLIASLASFMMSAASLTWWHEHQSYFNATIAHRLNAEPSPLLVSDAGDDATNLGNLISLSYRLSPNVRLLLLQDANWVTSAAFTLQTDGSTVIAFRPSQPLKQALERSRFLQPLLPEAYVWQVSAPERGV